MLCPVAFYSSFFTVRKCEFILLFVHNYSPNTSCEQKTKEFCKKQQKRMKIKPECPDDYCAFKFYKVILNVGCTKSSCLLFFIFCCGKM